MGSKNVGMIAEGMGRGHAVLTLAIAHYTPLRTPARQIVFAENVLPCGSDDCG